jgi:hypothetical protein
MADIDGSLKQAMGISGAIGAALVDYESGLALGVAGGGENIDMNVAAAGNADVVRAKLRTMEMLNITESIEDFLITLGNEYHLIRVLRSQYDAGLFLYLILDKRRANLGLARFMLRRIETSLEL